MTIQKAYELTKTPLKTVLSKELPQYSNYFEELIIEMRNRMFADRKKTPCMTMAYTWKPNNRPFEIEIHEKVPVGVLDNEEIYGDKMCGKFQITADESGKPILTDVDD